MTALSPAERQQRRRDGKKKEGWVKVEVWVNPEDAPLIKAVESVSQDTDFLEDVIDDLDDIIYLITSYREMANG